MARLGQTDVCTQSGTYCVSSGVKPGWSLQPCPACNSKALLVYSLSLVYLSSRIWHCWLLGSFSFLVYELMIKPVLVGIVSKVKFSPELSWVKWKAFIYVVLDDRNVIISKPWFLLGTLALSYSGSFTEVRTLITVVPWTTRSRYYLI